MPIAEQPIADQPFTTTVTIDHHQLVADTIGHVIARIEVDLTVVGNLAPEQRQRILEIAEKCPVQKAVSGGIIVDSALAAH